jgi:phosphate starvation-inducible protein PhoH and related proteins
MTSSYVFDDTNAMRAVCGPNDCNIPYLEKVIDCLLFLKGNRLDCICDSSKNPELSIEMFNGLIPRLVNLASITDDITEPEILMEIKALELSASLEAKNNEDAKPQKRNYIQVLNKTVFPKSLNQEMYIKAMESSQITFAIGPAGTGKTFLAVAYSLGQLLSGHKQKIILTRPVVEAGESLGFLPGDLSQKLNPYLKPLYDSMEAMITPSTIKRLEESGAIEIAPLAYMRGRSIHNACIILDEAQNTTRAQMKMFLTRIGENSCAIITGDVTQIDLPNAGTSGLVHAKEVLRDVEGIQFLMFNAKDTVRSRIVQRIIDAYEKEQN